MRRVAADLEASDAQPTGGDASASTPLRGIHEAFERAARAVGQSDDHDYAIALHGVRLRAAGTALAEKLTPAFAHLEAPPSRDPALTVHVWDSTSTGTAPPPLPRVREDETAPGALYYYADERVRMVYQPNIGTLSALDPAAGVAWYWAANSDSLPYWDRASPIRQILHWWLESVGAQQVHGAAVGTPDAGVLLAGKSGSGKSTTALSSLASSLSYAGDDYVAVSVEPEPWVHSLYNSGKVARADFGRFPHLSRAFEDAYSYDEKAVVYVHQHFPGKTAAGFPLHAVVIPRVSERVTARVVEAPRPAALAALAPTTIVQLHTAGQDSMTTMARLVRQVPSYFLDVGSDVGSISDAIGNLLARR